MNSPQRCAQVHRQTSETQIRIKLELDGSGKYAGSCGLPFVDHMLAGFARHGFFDLEVDAHGDLEVDAHHTLEDIGIVLGQSLRNALGDKQGIERFGSAIVPMDDALVQVVLDLSGRPWLSYRIACSEPQVGGIAVRLFHEFFYALSYSAGINLHIDQQAGDEAHHIFEATFKACGRALDQATRFEPRRQGVPSTKGILA